MTKYCEGRNFTAYSILPRNNIPALLGYAERCCAIWLGFRKSKPKLRVVFYRLCEKINKRDCGCLLEKGIGRIRRWNVRGERGGVRGRPCYRLSVCGFGPFFHYVSPLFVITWSLSIFNELIKSPFVYKQVNREGSKTDREGDREREWEREGKRAERGIELPFKCFLQLNRRHQLVDAHKAGHGATSWLGAH